eukprot:1231229-Prymnesium_polylepis.1
MQALGVRSPQDTHRIPRDVRTHLALATLSPTMTSKATQPTEQEPVEKREGEKHEVAEQIAQARGDRDGAKVGEVSRITVQEAVRNAAGRRRGDEALSRVHVLLGVPVAAGGARATVAAEEARLTIAPAVDALTRHGRKAEVRFTAVADAIHEPA